MRPIYSLPVRDVAEHRLLAALLVVALAVRLAWGWAQGADVDDRLPDQHEYLELGRSLLRGEGLRFFDARFQDHNVAFRTPGYPLFVAACGGNARVVRTAQAALDTLTVLGVYLLARRWMGERPALVAVLFTALNPFLVYFSGLILTETLFTFLLVWGMALLARRKNFLWGGLLLALSVSVRPAAVALPVIMGIAGAFVMHHRGELPQPSRWWRLPVGTTMVLLTLLVMAPWAFRNKMLLKEWVWTTTNGGITLYDGFNPDATGGSDQRFASGPEMARLRTRQEGDPRNGEIERDRYFRERAREWVRETWQERPTHLMKLTLSKIGRTWSPFPLSAEFGGNVLYKIVAAVFSIPLMVLAVLGLWGRGLPLKAKVFLVLPAMYFTIIHALTVGSLRYRVPVEPALAVLAAAGAAMCFEMLRTPTWKREGRVDDEEMT